MKSVFPSDDLLDDSIKHILKYDTEKKLLFSKKELLGHVSNWSIKLSPNDIPRDFITVLESFLDHIEPYFESLPNESLGLMEMNMKQLENFIRSNLITIKEFKKWNLSEMEYRQSVDPDDPSRDGDVYFVSSFQDEDPLYDFVDLDAFVRNVCFSIYDDQIEN